MESLIYLLIATAIVAMIGCPLAELFSLWRKEMDEDGEDDVDR